MAMLTTMMLASACIPFDLIVLAGDGVQGRAVNSPGGVAARNYLASELQTFAEPIQPGAPGTAGYIQAFSGGANVLGVIPGTDLASEYVVVGAHYDGLGTDCDGNGTSDTICNGATDNAAGVAIVLEIGRRLAAAEVPPRRSVVLAFWDAEEIGLLGSVHFVDNPLVPLADIYTYVNYDIQGSNLSPGLRSTTFAIAAESGGPVLGRHLATATATSADNAGGPPPLDTLRLSGLFGQLRSDYAPFLAAAVPTVFFTDSTGPCYHTVDDELAVVDLAKVLAQAEIGVRLTEELSGSGEAIDYVGGLPAASYSDAVTMATVLDRALADMELFSPEDQQVLMSFKATVDQMVAAGPDSFGAPQITILLSGAAAVVDIVATSECDGYLGGS